jgi:hypothetical protein
MNRTKEIDNKKNDSDNGKETLKNKITDTFKTIGDNVMTSLEAMNTTISNLHNALSEEKE